MNPRYKYRDVLIKIKPDNIPAALKHIEKTFRNMFPFQPYQYKFKEAINAEQYEREAKWKEIITYAAILTIFISCIGLFGLATLSAKKRTKEIGIRKVLGASVAIIVRKLSADFVALVILAAIIAAPVAYWIMNTWLQNYPYRINISWWMFGFASLSVVFIALFTISFQSVKAAIANPVKSLRSE
jgi:putative ABC transport system permease protein